MKNYNVEYIEYESGGLLTKEDIRVLRSKSKDEYSFFCDNDGNITEIDNITKIAKIVDLEYDDVETLEEIKSWADETWKVKFLADKDCPLTWIKVSWEIIKDGHLQKKCVSWTY